MHADRPTAHYIELDLRVFARPTVFDLWVEAEIAVALPLILDYTVLASPRPVEWRWWS